MSLFADLTVSFILKDLQKLLDEKRKTLESIGADDIISGQIEGITEAMSIVAKSL